MAETLREIERKYEAERNHRADGRAPLFPGAPLYPVLNGAGPVAETVQRGTAELDAVYYDTADRRLLAAGITLRRRTGGPDAGWHLKLPVAPGVRDEVRAPLTRRAVPRPLAALVRSRTRDAPLLPLMRIATRRRVEHLLDADGALLAEASTDTVTATRLDGVLGTARWTEAEIELAPGAGPALLDALEPRLLAAGLRPARSPSKLARALAELEPQPPDGPAGERPGGSGAGRTVLDHLRQQVALLVELDPGARLGTEDAVHQMRVATRRLRSAFRSYGKVVDRRATDPIAAELKWLAAELGLDRDREVLVERLRARLDELPRSLVRGPVRARVRAWSAARRTGSRRRLTAVLNGERYLALLDSLDALLADPPLGKAAARPPERVLAKAVLRDYRRLAGRMERALDTGPGPGRDTALHEARKAAKRVRYAAEVLGGDAARFARRMKSVQTLLGDHQDSVLARSALRELAEEAQAAGEPGFTYGLLYGREEQRAAADERELPQVWARASQERWREGWA
ncbi:CYTH and CHAD domain-containing protein [Streptomyces orinoci]|uniref:CYTH and CHAD domain-containing protein n=1 Tax=Streptomyces orinoci TaxID=67339 RepID=A0ABV3JQB5_STRON|nr:CYTH and CHAD domain-containing protein [Streptomyces orinoci]